METIKPILRNLIAEAPARGSLFKRNILKDYLQVVVLDYIYSAPRYSGLIFYGGSCLAHFFQLPRLSEDLDFIDETKKIVVAELARDLEDHFNSRTDLEVKATTQKFRIYLKFPILSALGLAGKGETEMLFLKVELFSDFNFCRHYTVDIRPLFRFNRSVLARVLDLPTLMATKIRAILYRKWEKTDKRGRTTVTVKGRDYFDLLWYLQKGIRPNLTCIEGINEIEALKRKLLGIVSRVDSRSIQLDLEALIEDDRLAGNLGRNMKTILEREINENF